MLKTLTGFLMLRMQGKHGISWSNIMKELTKVKGVQVKSLRRKYELVQMENNKTIAVYVLKIQGLVHKMKSYGEVMIEKMMIEKLIMSPTDDNLSLHKFSQRIKSKQMKDEPKWRRKT